MGHAMLTVDCLNDVYVTVFHLARHPLSTHSHALPMQTFAAYWMRVAEWLSQIEERVPENWSRIRIYKPNFKFLNFVQHP